MPITVEIEGLREPLVVPDGTSFDKLKLLAEAQLKAQAPSVGEKISGAFRTGREAIIRGAEFGGLPTVGRDPQSRQLSKMLAQTVLPETLPEAGALAAEIAVTGPGAIGRRFAGFGAGKRLLSRTGLPPAIAALIAKFTGEDPAEEALKVGVGTVLPEAVGGAIRGISKGVKAIRLRPALRKQAVIDANELINTLKREITGFEDTLRSGDPSSLLDVQAKGSKALSRNFEEFEEFASTSFRGERVQIDVPFTIPGGSGRAALTGVQSESVPFKKLAERVRLLKASARKAPRGAEGFAVREEARVFENNFRQSLFKKNPALLESYKTAVSEFDKGLDILTILKESQTLSRDTKGTFIDMEKLQNFILNNQDRFPLEKFPELTGFISRGGQRGAADVVSPITARAFIPGLGKALPGGSVALPATEARGLPLAAFTRRAGQPTAPGVLQTGNIQALFDLLGIRGTSSALPSRSQRRQRLRQSPFEVSE